MKLISILVLACIAFPFNPNAQVFYPVNHLSGTQTVGGQSVTVVPVNSPQTNTTCWGVYSTGAVVYSGYKFIFSKPVHHIQVPVGAIHQHDTVIFFANGSHYVLTSGSLFAGSCGMGTNPPPIITAAGDLSCQPNATFISTYGAVNFPFSSPVDSFRVMAKGVTYGLHFAGDTMVHITEPMVDTLLCSLDSVKLAYNTNGNFKTGNVFTAQLSNASGSFASPVTIGTKTATSNDTIRCQVPVNTPTGTGYKIRIIASNPKDTSEVTVKNIAIGNAPAPNLNAGSNGPVCSGSTLNLTASTSGTATYVWSWAGPVSFSSSSQNPSITNTATNQSGNYIVSARLHGCLAKDTVAVTINQTPAAITAGTNAPICDGQTLNLTSTNSTSGSSYSWAGPGSYSANTQNPTISGASLSHSGDYVVTATLTGCTAKDTVTILVKSMPAVPAATNNGPLCHNATLLLTANSTTSGVSYTWAGPASFNSNQQNPSLTSVTAINGGTYTVTATLNGCVSAPGSTNFVVTPIPATPTAGSNTPVCAGAAINLTANSATSGVTYSWTGQGGFSSTQQNPVIDPATPAHAGSYHVTALLNGCPSATVGSTVVAINNVSSIGAYPSPNDTICENSKNATLVAVPNNAGAAPQYQWYKNGNIISGANSLSYPATGIADGDTFHCRMIATGICSSPLTLFSNKIGMTVLPNTGAPTVSISASPGLLLSPWQLVTFTATPGGNAGPEPKYQWKRNGQNVSGATSDKWSANNLSDKDTISCVITSSEWCALPASVESNKLGVNIKTGVDDIDSKRGISLYPNPTAGKFVLTTSTPGELSLYNLEGQRIISYSIERQVSYLSLPPSIAPGLYIGRFNSSPGNIHTIRIKYQP